MFIFKKKNHSYRVNLNGTSKSILFMCCVGAISIDYRSLTGWVLLVPVGMGIHYPNMGIQTSTFPSKFLIVKLWLRDNKSKFRITTLDKKSTATR